MGYDIHAHAADQDATLLPPDLSLNLDCHRAVFACPAVDCSRHPLPGRMADFFADASFVPDEIAALRAQLEELRSESRGLQQEKYVNQILEVCRKAAEHAFAVTCYCD